MKKFLILIPYRNRPQHLATLLPHLHWYLKGQSFEIAVIEQGDQKKFNKGLLLNAGYKLLHQKFDYFVFHDVDLIPVKADYSFPKTPVHLGTELSQFGYKNIFPGHLHGVSIFRKSDFQKINGFSVIYRGWGVEDQDLELRCHAAQLKIQKRKGRFISLPHELKASQIQDSIKNWHRLEKTRHQDIFANGLDRAQFKVLSHLQLKFVELPIVTTDRKLKIPATHHHIVISEK